jgi:NADPH2:quinone reductase
MRAAVLSAFGQTPELREVAEPPRGGMTARVLAATITPVDHVVAAGRFPAPAALPMISGKEGIAEIIDAGGSIAAGSRVYFEFPPNRGGAFAERVTLTERDFIVEIGDTDPLQAAALGGSTGITAWTALTHGGELAAGETVLVLGATGPVGLAAIAIAKILGAARVVAAGRNAAGLAAARAAGADAIVDLTRDGDRLVEAFRDATAGGRLVQVGRATRADLVLPPAFLAKGLRATGYANFIAPAELRKRNYRSVLENIASRQIHAAYQTRPLAEFGAAWAATATSTYGRYLLEPGISN